LIKILYKINSLENLSIIEKEENKLRATIFKQNKLVVVTVASNGLELGYLKSATLNIPFKVYDVRGAVTGNNGTAGQIEINNNILKITATDQVKGLSHSFMAILVTFIKD